jgi:hypothetical protein
MDALTVLCELAADSGGVTTMPQALAAGVTKSQVDNLVRAGVLRRLAWGAYEVSGGPDPAMSRVRAALASHGPQAVAVLDTALRIHDIGGLRRTEQVHVSVPPRAVRTNDATIAVHQLTLASAQITEVDGIRVTTAVKTVADVILRADRYDSVAVLDSALNRKAITEEEFAQIPTLIRGRRGAVHARSSLAQADGRARSPLETRVRLRCVDGRVAPDEIGYVVRDDDGDILAEADMAWLRARLIAEADGEGPHRSPAALFEDRRRQNRLVKAGWLVLRFTWADTLRPQYIPYVVRMALRNRLGFVH